MLKKQIIILGVVAIVIAISAILVYNFLPQKQEITINFTDGSSHTIGRLFAIKYNNKQIDSIEVKIVDENYLVDFEPVFHSPLGDVIPLQISDNTWIIQADQLLDYSLEEGKYEIQLESNIGTTSFNLVLKDNRALVIIFGG